MGHFWNDMFTASTSRHTRNTAKNTKEANRLAKLHHAQITTQNAALLKVQTDALHYQRYATEPKYREQTDEAWRAHEISQAALRRSHAELANAKADRDAEVKNWAIRIPLLSLLAVGMLVMSLIWLPQLGIAKARSAEPRPLWRDGMTRSWATARDLALFKAVHVGPSS